MWCLSKIFQQTKTIENRAIHARNFRICSIVSLLEFSLKFLLFIKSMKCKESLTAVGYGQVHIGNSRRQFKLLKLRRFQLCFKLTDCSIEFF